MLPPEYVLILCVEPRKHVGCVADVPDHVGVVRLAVVKLELRESVLKLHPQGLRDPSKRSERNLVYVEFQLFCDSFDKLFEHLQMDLVKGLLALALENIRHLLRSKSSNQVAQLRPIEREDSLVSGHVGECLSLLI